MELFWLCLVEDWKRRRGIDSGDVVVDVTNAEAVFGRDGPVAAGRQIGVVGVVGRRYQNVAQGNADRIGCTEDSRVGVISSVGIDRGGLRACRVEAGVVVGGGHLGRGHWHVLGKDAEIGGVEVVRAIR